jgi:argininosuccinate synthase
MSTVKKVVLAYSGGLDTSIIIPWIKENYDGAEVIAYCGNVGQGDDLEAVRRKAVATGASRCIVEDLREEFIRDYCFEALSAGAVYEDNYLLGTALARPLLAYRQVQAALVQGADAVAHGATGKGNDQVRFEVTYGAFAPHLRVIAPWREWSIRSREQALAYAAAHGVPVDQSPRDLFSRDGNLWHLSHEGGPLEDTWLEPEGDMFQLSVSPEQAPDQPEYVVIAFDSGTPVAVNGTEMSPARLISHLNALGGMHGIGRADLVESRLVGMKSHGVYETPGGTILMSAHRELESIVLDRDTLRFKDQVALEYAQLVYNGMWYTPLREALDAFVDSTQGPVTGSVKMKLYKGNVIPAGRKSKFSLYREDFATFGQEDVYDQSDAAGFIHLYGLPLKVRALNGLPVSGLNIPKPDYSRFKRD